jgi:hypothetical protein
MTARREWQVLHRDWNLIDLYIRMAPSYGVTGVQFADRIAYSAAEVLADPVLAENLARCVRGCRDHGLSSYLWIHELHDVPPAVLAPSGRVDLSRGAAVWEFVAARYRRLWTLLPELDGAILTCSETQVPVLGSEVASDLSPVERVALLVRTLAAESRRCGKELVVRTFAHTRTREDWMQQALETVDEPVTVMMKCVPVDWHPFMPVNPSIRRERKHRVLVEMDHGHEFTGQGIIPYPDIDYTATMIRDIGRVERVAGFVTRVHRYENHAFGTPNWASIVAYCRLLGGSGATGDAVWLESLGEVYGAAAAPLAAPIFRDLEQVVRCVLFFRGFWAFNHSRIPLPRYAFETIAFWNHAKHFEDTREREAVSSLAESLRRPDAATVDSLVEEKEEALRRTTDLERRLCECRAALPAPAMFQLERSLRHLRAIAETARPFAEAFFASLSWLSAPAPAMHRRATAAVESLGDVLAARRLVLARQVFELDAESNYHHGLASRDALARILEGRDGIPLLDTAEHEFWENEE